MKILLIIGLFIVLYCLYSYYRIKKAYSLADVVYTKWADLGKKSNKKFKLFIAGDSIGTGVGATRFENSVAGRIAKYLSKEYHVILTNSSINGSKIKTLLKSKNPSEKQDLAVIFVSSNDVLRFTKLDDFRQNAAKALEIFSKFSTRLIIIGPANVGTAKFLPLPLRLIYLFRAPKYAEILKEASSKFKNVIYINSLKPAKNLGKYKQIYYSSDMLHPNDEGHKFWFEMIKEYLL